MDIWVQLARFSCFETERLRLRPFLFTKDCDWFYQVVSNPQNVTYILPVTVSKTDSDMLFVEAFLREPLGVWALEHHQTGRLLGMIRLEKIDKVNLTAELSYFTHRSVWGQGFATEALKALTFMAFHHLGLRKLYLITHAENLASQCVAQKNRFSYDQAVQGK